MMAIEKLSGGDHGHDHGHGHSHSSHSHSHTHGQSHSHGQNGHASHSNLLTHERHDSSEKETLLQKSGSMNTSPAKSKIQINITNENGTTLHKGHTEESAKNKQRKQTKLLSFMIGLLTHAAVDGIALGAVSAEGNAQSLSLLVFIALMGHKAPAAVSVTTFLKRKATPRKEIIKLCVMNE